MPIRSRHVAVSAVIGLALVFASCDKSPTSPRPPQQPGPNPPVTTVRIELVAPSEIAPGGSVQLTANAVKSDGSVENVSGQAQWTPATSEILQLGSTGLATGRERGEVLVTVRYGGQSATARVFVLPMGTFRLAGSIEDSDFGIANVTVAVLSGIGEGLTTLSGSDGSFALYGVSGPVRIHLKRDGYFNSIQQLDVTAHRTHDFTMVPDRPRDYSGTYALTITTDLQCSPTFPEAAKRRVYTANVVQTGEQLAVSLTGADFIVANGYGNRFYGFVSSTDDIWFVISSDYYHPVGEFDIVERFNDTALLVTGFVSGKVTPARVSATVSGEILIAPRTAPPFLSYNSRCSVDRFEMVRR